MQEPRGPYIPHVIDVPSVPDVLKANKWVVTISIAVVTFLAVLLNVRADDFLHLDAAAYQLFVVHLRTPWLTTVMEGLSNLSSPLVIAGMVLMVAAFAPGRRPGMCAVVNLVSVVAINQILKNIVQRPRPDGFRLISEVGYSFPSGHSMVSMAFYGLCAWMVWNYERDRIMRWLYCIAFGLLIVAVGISRVYLGVHYATDVIAGFCVSIVWVRVYTKIFCPLFMPEEKERHEEEVASPAYVEPAKLYVADDTKGMRARHMRWSTHNSPREYPTGSIPGDAIPAHATAASAAPSGATPAHATPADAIPADAVPSDAPFVDAASTGAIPTDAISPNERTGSIPNMGSDDMFDSIPEPISYVESGFMFEMDSNVEGGSIPKPNSDAEHGSVPQPNPDDKLDSIL